MSSRQVIVVGGGAAGFFAAIACAEASPETQVTILERGPRFLDKVRISGGGRCNVTNACADPRDFAARYPRGGQALLAPFQTFSARDTIEWFSARGVKLKTEADGRMFPVTDSSQTIVDCLIDAACKAGVRLQLNCGVESVTKLSDGRFDLVFKGPNADLARPHLSPRGEGRGEGERCLSPESPSATTSSRLVCDHLLLATGGCRAAAAGQLAVSLGHTLEPPVPSLFTFQIESAWLRSLAGISVAQAEVSVPTIRLRELGPLLVTHLGLSGPAVLRLSAWGARALHGLNYQFPLRVNWVPDLEADQIAKELNARRQSQPSKLVANLPLLPLPARLWEMLLQAAAIPRETRWATLSRTQVHALVQHLTRSEFAVTGKSLNKDEFVTCGGVRLGEIDFKTMGSRLCPGLFFAGELLDIDGITGGFNFQSAWTTGFIAGQGMAL